MESLSLILWRERELLESLLYKLEVERFVLASGNTRWLAMAATEVESVLTSIRETELLRAVVADEVASSLQMESNPSLRAMAEAVAEPWQSILLDHREAFIAYTREITELAASNRELLTSGQQAARELFLGLVESSDRYDPSGAVVSDPMRAHLLDRSI